MLNLYIFLWERLLLFLNDDINDDGNDLDEFDDDEAFVLLVIFIDLFILKSLSSCSTGILIDVTIASNSVTAAASDHDFEIIICYTSNNITTTTIWTIIVLFSFNIIIGCHTFTLANLF